MGISNPRPLNSLMVDVPPSWTWARLDEICNGVFDCPHATPKLVVNSDYLVVRTQDILTGIFRHESAGRVSADTYMDRIQRAEPVAGDLLYSREGTYFGIAAEVPKNVKVCLGQRMMLIRPKRELINSRYLRYWLNSPLMSGYIYGYRDGSVAERLNLPVVRGLPVALPPLQTQHDIAGILGALDDKIEVNRRMNATLESMARALFRQWFVENEEAQDWQEKALDEIANFLNGLALQNFPPEGNAFLPVVKIAQLRKNDTEGADKASTNIPSQYVVEDGDILFSWSGSLEVVIWCGGKGALNQHLFKVTSEKYPKWFYYCWTKHHLADFQEIAAGKATTMGHIQRHHLSDAKVLVPDGRRLREMDKFMSPLLDQIIITNLESRTLANLRDSLLPKLMRGEVRVKELSE